MTAVEAEMWWRYGAKHGLDPIAPRAEMIAANIAHLLSMGHGIKSKVTQEPFPPIYYMPWLAESEPISLESAMRTWS